MIVAKGETRRRREAVESLVGEVVRGAEADAVFSSVRVALERGWTAVFREALLEAERRKSADIDRICARNYEGFIESVEEILQMRGSAGRLTALVLRVHGDAASNGAGLIEVLRDQEKIHSERRETKRALDAAVRCREAARLVLQAKQQIQGDDHYGALKTIERIQQEQPGIDSENFSLALSGWLAELVDGLVGAAQREADAWLAQLRSKCLLLGQTIMRNCVHVRGDYKDMLERRSSLGVLATMRLGKALRIALWADAHLLDACVPADLHLPASAEGLQLIDSLTNQFSSLHKALYINSAVGDMKTFKIRSLDSKQRMLKGFLDAAAKALEEEGALVALPELLAKVAGFFIAECVGRQVVDYEEEGGSWLALQQLWERACADVARLCAHPGAFASLAQLHACREHALLLLDTMGDETFALRADPLLGLMSGLLPCFRQLAQSSVKAAVRAALSSASNQPYFVETAARFDADIRAFRLHAIEEGEARPAHRSLACKLDAIEADIDTLKSSARDAGFAGKTYPFSRTVPQVLRALYELVTHACLFLFRNEGVAQRGEAVVAALQDGALLVAREMLADLTEAGAGTPLAKACQLSIDAAAVAQALGPLLRRVVADALAQLQWTDSIDAHISAAYRRLQKEFTSVSNLGLDMVFENLNFKVEELLSSLAYENWEPQSYPDGSATRIAPSTL